MAKTKIVYTEITEAEAKETYYKGGQIYTSENGTDFLRIPCSGEYGSHAPVEVLYSRSVQKTDKTKFYIGKKEIRMIIRGSFTEGNKVTVDINGNIITRKVFWSAEAKDLYITFNHAKYFLCEFFGQ